MREQSIQSYHVPLALLAFAALFAAFYALPGRADWDLVYYPALHAPDPYQINQFFNPPWLLPILSPLALLPSHVAGSLWLTLSVLGIVYAAARLGADRWSYLCIIFSAPFVWFVALGNIDVLILIALFVPWPAASILLLAIKPQVLGVAILFKLREVSPIGVVAIAANLAWSLALFGFWPAALFARYTAAMGQSHPFSLGIFPYGIPIGLALLWYAWRRGNVFLGGMSTYFFVPYFSVGSAIVYVTIIFARLRGWPRVAAYGVMTALSVLLYVM